jgi:hypothetical protein
MKAKISVPRAKKTIPKMPKPRMKQAIPEATISIPTNALAEPAMYKCGGKVKKTGMAMVHKGEKVMTKAQQKKGKCC